MSGTSQVNTIPASKIVSVIPSVINAGGSELSLNGLMLTNSARIPIGMILSFPTNQAVSDYFGAGTAEDLDSAVYFAGFDNSDVKPGALLVSQYNTTAVMGYMRGGSLAGMTLAQLQALTGVLTVSLNGTPVTSGAINLSSATSFSNAAQLITTALGTTGPTQAVVTSSLGCAFTGTGSGTNLTTTSVVGVLHVGDTVTGTGIPANTTIVSQTSGTPGAAGVYVTSAATTAASAACVGLSNILEVTGITSGSGIGIGQNVTGTSVTAATYITALGTGNGGTGTYIITSQQHVVSESMTIIVPTVTYGSQLNAFVVHSNTTGPASTVGYGSGTIAASLNLTAATGAVISPGAAIAVPGAFMDAVKGKTQNWASFWHDFDPDGGSGNTLKLAFSTWNSQQNNRYAYIVEDTDIAATASTSATTSLGNIIKTTNLSGTEVIYQPTVMRLAAFAAGAVASLAFNNTNGRATLAFRRQAGLPISVTDQTSADNLEANGYNYTGDFATANDNFRWFYPGTVSGDFQWMDSYVNQIWLNANFQLALMTLLDQNKSVPYNAQGYGLIRSYCNDPIRRALNFGAIRTGVPLSSGQAAQVNNEAGVAIDNVLATQGWYLQIKAAEPIVRQARGTPPMKFWYMDGQSVQRLVLDSVLIQ